MSRTEDKRDTGYRYARPIHGQPEERWFASLSPDAQLDVIAATKDGLRARRDQWNAVLPPERQIPRRKACAVCGAIDHEGSDRSWEDGLVTHVCNGSSIQTTVTA